MEKGRIVIFAAGTGNPFFTTDTAAALRAAEMGCDALFKGTSVDGVYNADPKKVPDASRYESLSFDRVLTDNLKVMDASAVALCRENDIPIVVFNIRETGNLARSEEHTSELQSLMRRSYAVFCLKKKQHKITNSNTTKYE